MRRPPSANSRNKHPGTDWSNVADWYADHLGAAGSEYHQRVVLPGVLRLLEPKPGQKILDVASGQGVLCRLLAARGACVTGVESAAPLIERARQLDATIDPAAAALLTYLRTDARDRPAAGNL